MNGIDHRLRRLERTAGPPRVVLPWGRPVREWTSEQLLTLLGLDASATDDDLRKILGDDSVVMGQPGAVILGVEEASSADEWVQRYRGDVH